MKNLLIVFMFVCINIFSETFVTDSLFQDLIIDKLCKEVIIELSINGESENIKSYEYDIIYPDALGNEIKSKGYYIGNEVLIAWLCIDMNNNVTFLIWSDNKEFVYVDDLYIEVINKVIVFEDNGLKFEIKIKG